MLIVFVSICFLLLTNEHRYLVERGATTNNCAPAVSRSDSYMYIYNHMYMLHKYFHYSELFYWTENHAPVLLLYLLLLLFWSERQCATKLEEPESQTQNNIWSICSLEDEKQLVKIFHRISFCKNFHSNFLVDWNFLQKNRLKRSAQISFLGNAKSDRYSIVIFQGWKTDDDLATILDQKIYLLSIKKLIWSANKFIK